MGNSEPEGWNPNFDIREHERKMNQVQASYYQQNIDAPGAYYSNKPSIKTMNYNQLKRESYLYKPSINIEIQENGQAKVHFEYEAKTQCKLQIAFGVKRVKHNSQTKKIEEIDCLEKFQETLAPGSKAVFEKEYKVVPLKQLLRLGIILVINVGQETNQYDLTYLIKIKSWKVMVETYSKDGHAYGIEDIYAGSEESQDCIICFSAPSTTMITPCNHLCLCSECAKVFEQKQKNCPICRKPMFGLVTLKKN